ncbi:MAG: hypothetical protein A3I39_01210 [Candidatus Yanofskybacteria bacterium RIFCSPLOWO2_02_FULL_47_9b]|uniref:Uncharacterized protein n=1 Tax=Candidatus Yanofskybacteria bacterium RIFCSPLOWO2_02_FULL_47_9b TaxID=1802708 RepID=A0A1F8H7M5_9BACT|nr:MAG: hypothetical protein A3I39_01210 [Candidatus Yanofskybacteria bacterium RIFCSPLOWO2_02_FULL_47_9b]
MRVQIIATAEVVDENEAKILAVNLVHGFNERIKSVRVYDLDSAMVDGERSMVAAAGRPVHHRTV